MYLVSSKSWYLRSNYSWYNFRECHHFSFTEYFLSITLLYFKAFRIYQLRSDHDYRLLYFQEYIDASSRNKFKNCIVQLRFSLDQYRQILINIYIYIYLDTRLFDLKKKFFSIWRVTSHLSKIDRIHFDSNPYKNYSFYHKESEIVLIDLLLQFDLSWSWYSISWSLRI